MGDDQVPQKICNFVLTLALIYNDCKDGIFSNMILTDSKPKRDFELSRDWGAYNGIKLHYIRLHVALVHELLQLIEDNQQILKHPFFKSVIQKLSKKERESWNALATAALQKQTRSSLNKFLLMIRNKVSFHYDPKGLYKGFRHHFFRSGVGSEAPFISRGTSMQRSRFYFADAAADGYLASQTEQKYPTNFMDQLADLTTALNKAILQIVVQFIYARGFAYQDFTSQRR
ncbi:MAG: hypothetical protein ACM3SP_09220 [Chloroflexota bacterium]